MWREIGERSRERGLAVPPPTAPSPEKVGLLPKRGMIWCILMYFTAPAREAAVLGGLGDGGRRYNPE